MRFLVDTYLYLTKWDGGTQMGAVNMPKMADFGPYFIYDVGKSRKMAKKTNTCIIRHTGLEIPPKYPLSVVKTR